MRVLLLLLGLGLSTLAWAEEDNQKPVPLDPAYKAVHSMVLMSNASKLVAYIMPDYSIPQDVQILYRVSFDTPAVIYLVRDADLVTVKPEAFNLQRLLRGESFSVKADIYMGHLRRGGMRVHEQVELTFDKLLYSRKLDALAESGSEQVYDSVPLGTTDRILIHQLQKAPSFDHLILLYEDISCITQFRTSKAVPEEGELLNRLSFCGAMKPLYYESASFAN